jgi:hypothetical protein
MASEIPVVRYFVPCREIDVAADGREVTLRKLIHGIVRQPGEPFPCTQERMALYAVLANGRGEHDFEIELVFFDQGNERSRRRPWLRKDMGQDPSEVWGFCIPLTNVVFEQPGQYTFYLLCDGQRIAEAHFEVR